MDTYKLIYLKPEVQGDKLILVPTKKIFYSNSEEEAISESKKTIDTTLTLGELSCSGEFFRLEKEIKYL